MLTLLHTSDWHLGRRLYNQPRYDEFAQFLSWQTHVIDTHQVDVLLIAGDIFDTSTPSNQAQTLYYQFLNAVNHTACRHVVIVAGNHDSPSFLDAPKTLLKGFDIHVIGAIGEDLSEEILVLNDANGIPELIVVAVPYLRDRDVRTVGNAENLDTKERKLTAGIQAHYEAVTSLAIAKQTELQQQIGKPIPMVATGHLFAVGGETVEGDGVRELYVGSLAHVRGEMFDPCFDYVALGHLHVPQAVGGLAHIRYSGSPIAMGFGESRQQKQVHLVRFFADEKLLTQPIFPLIKTLNESPLANPKPSLTATKTSKKSVSTPSPALSTSMDLFGDDLSNDDFANVDLSKADLSKDELAQNSSNTLNSDIPLNLEQPYNIAMLSPTTLLQSLAVPVFQPLASVKGDWATIETAFKQWRKLGQSVWVEVVYEGEAVKGDLQNEVQALIKDSDIKVLRIKNQALRQQTLQAQAINETLEELNEIEVFERCLTAHQVPIEQQEMLRQRYFEVLADLKEQE
ncbi:MULTISPECIES: exonuclease SbcCD subunit D C-terminal domain-containing protein [unclassified Moraxella]|uniref:exonuclease SbcCD subunit D C-terminal domain-containing protein n=1 Tax=unclassified Moraxella TaxID=2685852 RepID=UPI003AF62CF0